MKIGIGVVLGFVSVIVASTMLFVNSASAATTLLSETFAGDSTVSGQWLHGGNSICLTGGNSATPATSYTGL